MVEPVEILRYARDVVLESEDKWTRGAIARDARRLRTDPVSPAAAAFCIRGANRRAAADLGCTPEEESIANCLFLDASPEGIIYFNDYIATFPDVIDRYDLAIKKAEEA